MTDEEKKAIERLEDLLKERNENKIQINTYDLFGTIETILNLIEKQSKEIEELKREKETNHQMIQLAETQILGYGQGYKDGLNKETTATAIVARERENQIIYEGMKHKINMEWVLKIKAKIEELNDINSEFSKRVIKGKEVYLTELVQNILQSLLEKE